MDQLEHHRRIEKHTRIMAIVMALVIVVLFFIWFRSTYCDPGIPIAMVVLAFFLPFIVVIPWLRSKMMRLSHKKRVHWGMKSTSFLAALVIVYQFFTQCFLRGYFELVPIAIVSVLFVVLVAILVRAKMRAIFVLSSTSEILRIADEEERCRVHSEGLGAFIANRRTWVIGLISFVAVMLVAGAFLTLAEKGIYGGSPNSMPEATVRLVAFFLVIQWFTITLIYRRRFMRNYIRKHLCEHGTPVCLACGYDLHGIESHNCPECGKPFELKKHPTAEGDCATPESTVGSDSSTRNE